jgi:hypothetical protein
VALCEEVWRWKLNQYGPQRWLQRQRCPADERAIANKHRQNSTHNQQADDRQSGHVRMGMQHRYERHHHDQQQQSNYNCRSNWSPVCHCRYLTAHTMACAVESDPDQRKGQGEASKKVREHPPRAQRARPAGQGLSLGVNLQM